MKIQCNKSDLLNSVNIVLKAVPVKSTMPILEYIVIDATGNDIKLITNNMELGIETIVEGNILEKGSVALNAKVFSEIVRKLPDSDVNIDVGENNKTNIICERANFNISGLSSENFPYLPSIEKDKPIVLSQFTLKELIRQTVFSISENENNKVMTGEIFEIKKNELEVVALDGHRLSIRKIEMKEEYDDNKIIVPGNTLKEISKILSGEIDDLVNMFITDKHILFEFDDTIVLSRLIEGKAYNIDNMLSYDYGTKISINKQKLQNSIERASLLIRNTDSSPVIIKIKDNNLQLNINTELGEMNEEVEIEQEGKNIIIGFNSKYLLDVFKVIDDEIIDIYFINPKAPCFIKNKEESYIYFVSPVNIPVSISDEE